MPVKRVLVVDDEAPMRFMLSKQLNRAGFDTVTAADGEAALTAAAANAFDAIVLDVVMPGMDGFEVCRRLKADPLTAGTPVLFLSASCSGEFRRRAFRLGADDFLAKPFETNELPTYIQAILRRRENSTPMSGHVISVIGAGRGDDASATAIRLAETAALQGPGPAMLIDLELPAGYIGARLQLSGGPNMRVLLQETGEPVSMETIGRVAQRYHGTLEVMPAPFTPAQLNHGQPVPQRLGDVLDLLKENGYYVVVHLGTRLDELTLTAVNRSESIWMAAGDNTCEEHEAQQATLLAAGIAHEQLLLTHNTVVPNPPPSRARARKQQARSLESVAAPLAVVA